MLLEPRRERLKFDLDTFVREKSGVIKRHLRHFSHFPEGFRVLLLTRQYSRAGDSHHHNRKQFFKFEFVGRESFLIDSFDDHRLMKCFALIHDDS